MQVEKLTCPARRQCPEARALPGCATLPAWLSTPVMPLVIVQQPWPPRVQLSSTWQMVIVAWTLRRVHGVREHQDVALVVLNWQWEHMAMTNSLSVVNG